MNKKEFADELRGRLSGLPEHDTEERISFYIEMIDEHMANGDNEETAVAAVGPIDPIVEQIMSEIPLTKIVKDKVKPKKKVSAPLIILLVLGFPVWFPLALTALIIMFTFYLVFWILILAFFIVALGLCIGAVAAIACVVMYILASNPAGAVFAAGAGSSCAGLAVLTFTGTVALSAGLLKLTGKILIGIKRSLAGKEGVDDEIV